MAFIRSYARGDLSRYPYVGDPGFGSFFKRVFKPITKAAKKWTWKGAAGAATGLAKLAAQVAPLVPGVGTAIGGLAKAPGLIGAATRIGMKVAPIIGALRPSGIPQPMPPEPVFEEPILPPEFTQWQPMSGTVGQITADAREVDDFQRELAEILELIALTEGQ